jgi:FlaA1/EpsC-like NDP-sugar epimerase
MTSFLTSLPKSVRNLVMVFADALVLPMALWSAVALRQGQLRLNPAPPLWMYVLAVAITLPVFLKMGLYRAVVRYFETRAFLAVIGAAAVAAVLFGTTVMLLAPDAVPDTSLIIYGLLSAGYAALTRLIARQILRREVPKQQQVPVAVYGAGAAGRQLVQGLRQGTAYKPVLLVDDAQALHGRTVMGLTVHPAKELSALVDRHQLAMVIVAIPSMTPGQRARLLQKLGDLETEVRLMPGMVDLVRGTSESAELREVSPEDLLGRDAVMLDQSALTDYLSGQVVMVTGAGGSIGSELCRQIAQYAPKRLVVFDISEFSLYALREEFVAMWPKLDLVCVVGDVKNAQRVAHVMGQWRPKVVFHAAAYKHVPMMEQVNAWEAVRNNAYGTCVVGQEAIKAGVFKFVLVSTDKAVNPTNVMGATKRLAELTCQALHSEGKTQFEMVRFGNVLGSSGSVIPKFRQQISQGGPITVTHPDIVRYFMSIPEAAQLVLQSSCMGHGGEVFVLDMGEPVKIVDLARNMIRLAGRSQTDIAIEFTGLRPGEKLFEELLVDTEFTRPTHHPKIRVAKVQEADAGWCEALTSWVESSDWQEDHQVRQRLAALIPEYQPWAERA